MSHRVDKIRARHHRRQGVTDDIRSTLLGGGAHVEAKSSAAPAASKPAAAHSEAPVVDKPSTPDPTPAQHTTSTDAPAHRSSAAPAASKAPVSKAPVSDSPAAKAPAPSSPSAATTTSDEPTRRVGTPPFTSASSSAEPSTDPPEPSTTSHAPVVASPPASSGHAAVTSSSTSTLATSTTLSTSALSLSVTQSSHAAHTTPTLSYAMPSILRGTASSALPSVSAVAATAAASSTGLSGGAIAGVVIAVICGVGALGALGFYFWKKKQDNGPVSGWAKMDDDMTPYPAHQEKPGGFYGSTEPSPYSAAAAGGAAGLAVPRGHADYYNDGARPVSEVGENFAGYGTAGRVYGGSAYPTVASAPVATYGLPQPYPDQPHSPHSPNSPYYGQPGMYPQEQQHGMQHDPFDDPALSPTHSDHSGPRQLVGPGQQFAMPQPFGAAVPAPIPLGRPEAPNTYDDIAAAELYADDRYADDHTAGHVQGSYYPDPNAGYDPTYDHQQQLPQAQHYAHDPAPAAEPVVAPVPVPQQPMSPHEAQRHMSPQQAQLHLSPHHSASPLPEPVPVPQLTQLSPMSPLMAPAPNHADVHDDDETSRMYGEVAAAAGLPMDTGRYQHGQPLAPLPEVVTPISELSRPIMPEVPEPPTLAAELARPLPTAPVAASPSQAPQPAVPTAAPPAVSSSNANDNDDAYGGM